mmetsp:Transcript_15628/g.17652  ORF Transcript_15628/g.17652 Transcript_15628/m.17652 type:complete len:301 (-) Transcript_15628:866-1768(-)|eukprot:CAMPEP_0184011426 /NCGR_PEP_ID=MMETSP0954-20121128/3822_1 /TAXON_ID=627963 /ORGANISM="Aplanochytrium sp, Strain PBS07" /LENGTH=300 /DNA_ID=CAMNT_0026291245 /DNA_START=234 /DNA_END=1136 /DNA_ORIENTATION=+
MSTFEATGQGWADIEDETYLPPKKVVGPDEKGIKVVTEYKMKGNQRVKTTTKIKVVTRERKISKKIQQRKTWGYFGAALAEGNAGRTTKSPDEILMENPADEMKNANKEEENLLARLREGMAKREFNKKMRDQGLMDESGGSGGGGLRTGTALSQALAAGEQGSSSGKYVPVHLRGGAETRSSRYSDREGEQNTLRVTNISEDTNEADLQDLFKPFGPVARIYLAKDRETQVSRGFAYVSYIRREHAEKAMNRLNGYGYDHLILKVEWAKPSTKEDISQQNVLAKGYASGYGKALPQGLK